MTEPDGQFVLVDQTGTILCRVEHGDDFSDVEAEPRDHRECYRVMQVVDWKLTSEREFGPYVVGADLIYEAQICNNESSPDVVEVKAGAVSIGDWLFWPHAVDGPRFDCITATATYATRVDIFYQAPDGEVAVGFDRDADLWVALDPDWAKDWQARRTQ